MFGKLIVISFSSENEETQGSLQRERKRKRKQRTNAALKAKKMKEAVAKRQQQQESLDAQEEDNQEHETEPPTAKIERKSRTTDREHPAPQVPTPRQTQVVRPLQATRQPLQPGKESFMKEIARVQVRVQTAIDGIGHVRLAVILSRLFDLGIDPLKVQSAGALDEDTLHLAKQRVRQMIAVIESLLAKTGRHLRSFRRMRNSCGTIWSSSSGHSLAVPATTATRGSVNIATTPRTKSG